MDGRDQALSLLGWWRLAGVDVMVDETPRDWLAPERAPAAMPAARASSVAVAPPPAPAVAALPVDLAALQAFLATNETLGEGRRIAPRGAAESGLMILADMPEQADLAEGVLFAGQLGLLFDRMLAAIGRDRASAYLAPLSPVRPAGGRLAPTAMEPLSRLAKHHVRLAAPRALLLLGEAASRAILGLGHVEARGRVHEINLNDVKVAAVATIHPRELLRNAGRKADAWRDLRLLLEVFDR